MQKVNHQKLEGPQPPSLATSRKLSEIYQFTSESVTEGHPDKLADQISDALLDFYLSRDPGSRVACETLVAKDWVVVAGEVTSAATPSSKELEAVVRGVIHQCGYTHAGVGFQASTCGVALALNRQSPDIARAVNQDPAHKKELGAGDQGLVFGYAVKESETAMPWSLHWAHALARQLSRVRREGRIPHLYPDGKTQVTVEYEKGKLRRIAAVVISAHHAEALSLPHLREALKKEVIDPILPQELRDSETRYLLNPGGPFHIGGPVADTGLTGRKIIVDTYGGHGAHGGGAFSGKDPSKVDRSGAYLARWLAKHLVVGGWMDRCLVQIGYVIGASQPVNLWIEPFGTLRQGTLQQLTQKIHQVFPFQPGGIIEALDLTTPRYQKTAAFGHFGRDQEGFPWEEVSRLEALRKG